MTKLDRKERTDRRNEGLCLENAGMPGHGIHLKYITDVLSFTATDPDVDKRRGRRTWRGINPVLKPPNSLTTLCAVGVEIGGTA